MSAIAWASVVLILAVVVAGCAPMTPEQQAALEAQPRQLSMECQSRGGMLVSGSCVSRRGGQ